MDEPATRAHPATRSDPKGRPTTEPVTFTFGDNRALCDELLALVRARRKTATCNRLEAFGESGEPLPEPGRRDTALDWDGNPAVTVETLTVQCIRFCDVGRELALAEGENDDLEGWRHDHRVWFERNGGWHPEMWLIFETFRMVEDLAPAAVRRAARPFQTASRGE